MPAQFIVKWRSIGVAGHNPYRPHQIRYGPWMRTAASCDSYAEAREHFDRTRGSGVVDHAIFYRGLRLVDGEGVEIRRGATSAQWARYKEAWEEIAAAEQDSSEGRVPPDIEDL